MDCLLEDLHNALHKGEKCPECGHDPYAAPTQPLQTNDPGLGNNWFGNQDRVRGAQG